MILYELKCILLTVFPLARITKLREKNIFKKIIILALIVLTGCGINNNSESILIEKQNQAANFIKSLEGLRLKAYTCAKSEISIGYGTKSYRGEIITEKIAEKRFLQYLNTNVWKYVPKDLSINQYVVYASLEYNLGHYKAKNILINGKLDCKKILNYKKVDGKINQGIINRRQREYKLCIK